MRKLALTLLLCLALTGCGNSNSIVSEPQVQESARPETVFERHPLDDEYSILVEKETGVCYFEYKLGYAIYGITIMLNPDGTPKIWED